jgi:CDP-glycerol glycerophosphotransferase (TagB/SpsB family)
MNPWQKLLAIPYIIVWHILNGLHRAMPIILYCSEPSDYELFRPVQKHLPFPIEIVARGQQVRQYLRDKGIVFKRYPAFPKAVIMFRHQAHRFPGKKIIRIGLRHGPYHFKKFTRPENYNLFRIYMMTSRKDVQEAEKAGITSGRAVGYPKLDVLFDGSITEEYLDLLRSKAGLDVNRKTILITSTYNKSGMSAVKLWMNRLPDLTEKYNVLVSLHPWISRRYRQQISVTPGVYQIEEADLVGFMMLSDLLIGDSSSIIAEYCALDRPIITFIMANARRKLDEIASILKEISLQVKDFDQLQPAIKHALAFPDELGNARHRAVKIFFDDSPGRAGRQAAELIMQSIH